MQALILGATGATGQTLTQQLLADARFQSVTVFARRELALAHDKLTTHIVDFRQPETWQDKVRGDVLFSCLARPSKLRAAKKRCGRLTTICSLPLPKPRNATACRVMCWCRRRWRMPTPARFIRA